MAALEDMDTWLEEGGFLTGEYWNDYGQLLTLSAAASGT